ncbi:S8 family serine peptidase [Microbacterium ureisolvens]|uniref:S8 family serine peptidase n=1 Tax=Microbacterium ureisolvens TaxID=2781186 RepID=A0ABS7HWR7_9MICO|nr:S8 family serine peptidase [Microbacterium ureisolvens]MBW9109249.1 S8 family serine peptidase [Microbacterium ureisolvens]
MRYRARKSGAIVAAGVIAAATAVTAPAAAAAAPATPAPPATSGWVSTPPSAPVTLITGDKVALHEDASGKPVVEFTPAPRASNVPVSYSAYGDEDHYYVIPSDVAALVPGELDLNLFDVKTLASIGGSGVPVIVKPADDADAKASAAQWKALDVDADRTLESIDAVSGEVPAEGAPALVEELAEGDAVEKVWLDSPVTGADLTSAPQIGAPAAWEAGLNGTGTVIAVLDSGIDTTHPDLDEGIVIAEKDFTGSGSPKDEFGHGTHVASIVAGSGEASGGDNRGIAYGAKLLNARVINAHNEGATSWIIDAMEWAAQQGADVINMSLGIQGEYTDGTDPGSLAVDSISERYDTLVVIAAGNDGEHGATTVTTPGTAQSALTVGALNQWDGIATFSSRGPRFGDAGVKPDITAPGAEILAARAAGTMPEIPADQLYFVNGGTSMAAPAVAGAAAILKSARPDLDGEALKAVLMGTAVPTYGDIWREGAGKVMIPTALGQPLYADPASLSFGVFMSPRATQEPRTKTLTYTNTGDTDLTLHLVPAVSGPDGQQAPAGLLSLSADTLTVPAHGTASVDVTIDPHADDPDFYTGTVTAAGAGFSAVRTVIGFQIEPNMATVHLTATQPDGLPVESASIATFYGIDDPSYEKFVQIKGGKADVRLPLGRYAILGTLINNRPGAALISGTTLFTLDVDLPELGEYPVEIDGTRALPVTVDTEKKAQVTNYEQVLARTLPGRWGPVRQTTANSAIISQGGLPDAVYMLAQGELEGEETLGESWMLGAPELDVKVSAGSASIDLSEELRYGVTSPELTGKVSAAIVDAGAGTPAELAEADVTGKIALVEAHPAPAGDPRILLLNAQAEAAKDAGALALIAYGATDGPYWEEIDFRAMGEFPDKVLPTLTLSRAKGLEVVALASGKKGAKVTGTGHPYAPYDYVFGKVEQGIPSSLAYRLDSANTATVESEMRGQVAGSSLQEWHMVRTPATYIGFVRWTDEPIVDRTIHYYADPDVLYQHDAEAYAGGGDATVFPTRFRGEERFYAPGETGTQTLLGQVVHGGLLPAPASPWQASVYRDGDTLGVNLPYRVDGEGHPNTDGPDGGTDSWFELWQDDVLIATSEYPSGWLQAPAEEHTYRLAFGTSRYERWWTQSTKVSTEWTFTSGTADAATILPLLQLDYGVQDLTGLNVASGKKVVLKPVVSHQDGSTGSAIQGLKLWASYDTGKTWTAVAVSGSAGAYSATITPPKGTTKIALKSEAWDAAGGVFKETVIDAIALQ